MSDRFERRLHALTADITAAAVAYEARWTLASLFRTSSDIAGKLNRQIVLWNAAARDGDHDEIELQGRALIRGYRKASEIMSASGAEDDAYTIGKDEASGLTLAIGHQIASAEHVAQKYGPDVVFLTPDEVAGLLNSLNGFAAIASMKRAWPGAVALPSTSPRQSPTAERDAR